MDTEEDPFVTLEKMLANRGKKRSPVRRSSKVTAEAKKKAVPRVVVAAESGEEAEACEVGSAGEEPHDSESSEIANARAQKKPRTEVTFTAITDSTAAKALLSGPSVVRIASSAAGSGTGRAAGTGSSPPPVAEKGPAAEKEPAADKSKKKKR